MVFRTDHLQYLLSEYLAHYHAERPHQGLGNRPPTGLPPDAAGAAAPGEVVYDERLGGLLRHDRRRAA